MNIEIRSGKFQIYFATFIFCIFVGISIYGIAYDFSHATRTADYATKEGLGNFIGSIVCFSIGFYIWWTTIRFKIYANNNGIGQSNGFRNQFIQWNQISSYTIEPIYSRQRLLEPVLRDSNARVLMKPVIPGIIYTSKGLEERAQFWQIVMTRIDEQRVI